MQSPWAGQVGWVIPAFSRHSGIAARGEGPFRPIGLGVAALGRALAGDATVRHKIERASAISRATGSASRRGISNSELGIVRIGRELVELALGTPSALLASLAT